MYFRGRIRRIYSAGCILEVESGGFTVRVGMMRRIDEGKTGVRGDSKEFELSNQEKEKSCYDEAGRMRLNVRHDGLEMPVRCLGGDILPTCGGLAAESCPTLATP